MNLFSFVSKEKKDFYYKREKTSQNFPSLNYEYRLIFK